MKSVVLLISLLVAFSSSCTATTTPNQVLKVVRDTDGNILISDNRYFVVSSRGGGVSRGSTLEGTGKIGTKCHDPKMDVMALVLTHQDKLA
ncbi:hypothetical protein KY284_016976 [Solanum tuberosum]|nr:hypothetical protein KY284_016976 [Solanum tuberosum]